MHFKYVKRKYKKIEKKKEKKRKKDEKKKKKRRKKKRKKEKKKKRNYSSITCFDRNLVTKITRFVQNILDKFKRWQSKPVFQVSPSETGHIRASSHENRKSWIVGVSYLIRFFAEYFIFIFVF